MNLNTEKFKVISAQSTGRTFIGIITGEKVGTKKQVYVARVEESEGVNTADNRAVEKFLNNIDESRLERVDQDRFQKCELSEPGEVDNYVLIDITPEYAGKDCVIRYRTGELKFKCVQCNMTYKRNEVSGKTAAKRDAKKAATVSATTEVRENA